jgi:hypothetical protein
MLQSAEQISTRLLEEAGVLLPERLQAVKKAWDNAVSHLEAKKGMAGKDGVEYVPDNQAQARAREHIFGVNRIAYNGNHADTQSIQVVNVVYNSPAWAQPDQAIEAKAEVISDGPVQAIEKKEERMNGLR